MSPPVANPIVHRPAVPCNRRTVGTGALAACHRLRWPPCHRGAGRRASGLAGVTPGAWRRARARGLPTGASLGNLDGASPTVSRVDDALPLQDPGAETACSRPPTSRPVREEAEGHHHRGAPRSIWQVLGVYLVGSWLGYQVILALTDGLGLPQWVPPFAVVLFIIGLPIVLATAFVQEGPPAPRPAAPRDPDTAAGHRTVRRIAARRRWIIRGRNYGW
jgi:hypothetical protein